MAGISVPQYEVFKIGSNKLKYFKWDLKISKKEAFKYGELISLFENLTFILASSFPHSIKSPSVRVRWDIPKEEKYIASIIFVFPCALKPVKIFIFEDNFKFKLL